MPRDIGTLLERMRADGYFETVARTPAAQFGPPARPLLGATLLPEREVEENAYREENVRFRTVIANAGSRYSPVQKKGADLVSSFLVETGSSDIGADFTSRDYDSLLRLVRRGADMEAMERLVGWMDIRINRALTQHNERNIWQAIVNAQVIRRGDNGYYEVVNYANPAGHRFNAGGQWSSDNYDPFDDITPAANILDALGYTVNRIFYGQTVRSILQANAKIQSRAGGGVVAVGGSTITLARRRATREALNGIFESENLPTPEEYNAQYRTQTSSGYFLARNVLVMCATTGQDVSIDLGDDENLLENVLGYTAIGRPAGEPEPGRVIQAEWKKNKPRRIEGEGWQESIPVLTEPEAIVVIGGIG